MSVHMAWRILAAVAFGLGGLTLATCLLYFDHIEAQHYCILAPFMLTLGIVIYALPRILEFSLSTLTVKMAQIESAREEILAKEEDVRKLALALGRLVGFRAFFEGRAMGGESFKICDLGTDKLMNDVIEAIRMDESTRQDFRKYEIARKNGMPWEDILKMMRADMAIPDSAFPDTEPN